jgi:hypothetical protein
MIKYICGPSLQIKEDNGTLQFKFARCVCCNIPYCDKPTTERPIHPNLPFKSYIITHLAGMLVSHFRTSLLHFAYPTQKTTTKCTFTQLALFIEMGKALNLSFPTEL